MNKEALRRHMKNMRLALAANPAEHSRRSHAVQSVLLGLPQWKKAEYVFAYSALRGEVDTALLLQKAWAAGKRVLLPRCSGQAGCMDMVPCGAMADLAPAAYGIWEPKPELAADTGPWPQGSVVLTPGLAFDRAHFRLGYGGGYYDRFFAAHPNLVGVGLCFNFQLVERVPREAWDLPLHHICTEDSQC